MNYLLVSEFLQHFIADVYSGRTEDDAIVAGTVENQAVAALFGNLLDSGIDFLLDGGDERGTLLEEFSLRSEVFALQF